ncbi:MAG: ion channel [Spirochaetales bacterium]
MNRLGVRLKEKDLNKKRHNGLKKIGTVLKKLFTDSFVQYTLILSAVFVGVLIFIFVVEKKANPDISGFLDVIWFALVTVTTVGYGDIAPVTLWGRVAGIVLLLFGVIAFAAVSGKVASVLFDKQLKKERGLINLKNISHHLIICGWKHGFERILDGVLASNPKLSCDNIVLINTAPTEYIENIKSQTQFQDIQYICGDYTQEATLMRANIKSASRVLVLADYSQNFSALEMDSRTVLAVLTIASLNPKIYSVAELIDSGFERHLEVAHCDEILLTGDYERSLLVSASTGIGLSHVFKHLITEVAEKGLFIDDIDSNFFDKTYGEYKNSLSDSNRILVGLLENTGNFYHRRREALKEAQKNPDMGKIVDNLKKVKMLKSNEPIFVPADNYSIKPNAKGIFICASQETSGNIEEE